MPGEPVQDIMDLNDRETRMEYGALTAADDLAFALLEARRKSEVSQSELAEIIGTSQAYIAKLESGEANPTMKKVGAILAALWFRLDMRPVPLRLYEPDRSSVLNACPARSAGSLFVGSTEDTPNIRLRPMNTDVVTIWFSSQYTKPGICFLGQGEYVTCR